MSQFMVEFDLPSPFPTEFIALIPEQRIVIDQMLADGKIHSYALSFDRERLWCIVNADNDFEVLDVINEFPLIDQMKYQMTELMFNNSVVMKVPAFSIN